MSKIVLDLKKHISIFKSQLHDSKTCKNLCIKLTNFYPLGVAADGGSYRRRGVLHRVLVVAAGTYEGPVQDSGGVSFELASGRPFRGLQVFHKGGAEQQHRNVHFCHRSVFICLSW